MYNYVNLLWKKCVKNQNNIIWWIKKINGVKQKQTLNNIIHLRKTSLGNLYT